MITVQCPNCLLAFSKQRIPKVLPCGHSMCSFCMYDTLQQNGFYPCRNCAQKFDPSTFNYSIPTNILFYDMIQKIQQFIRQKQWEQGASKQIQSLIPAQSLLKIQQQCLYTFCQRKKFQRDGVFQLYCSQECKKNHEQLQQVL